MQRQMYIFYNDRMNEINYFAETSCNDKYYVHTIAQQVMGWQNTRMNTDVDS